MYQNISKPHDGYVSPTHSHLATLPTLLDQTHGASHRPARAQIVHQKGASPDNPKFPDSTAKQRMRECFVITLASSKEPQVSTHLRTTLWNDVRCRAFGELSITKQASAIAC